MRRRIAVLCTGLLFGASLVVATPTVAVAVTSVPRPDHVVVVIEENHANQSILGNADAPYINSLAASGANMTNFFAETHPSQPNYLALFAGGTQGVTDDSCPHTFTTPNLGSESTDAGVGFAGYSEGLPSIGYAGCTFGAYARKHNPWVNFGNVPTSANLPLTAFPTDYSQLPAVSFVVPNLINDMHDGTIAQGDAWLQSNLGGYATWAQTHNSLFVVTFDEDDGSQANQIATIFTGQRVQQGQYPSTLNHYNLLRTIEDAYGLAPVGASASASPILDIWTPPSGNQPPAAVFTSSCAQLTCSFDASGSTDPEGSILSYSWAFGDGVSGSGVTVSHGYAVGGSQSVVLTVTDDQGVSSSVTHLVSPMAPAGAPFVSDAFNRTVRNGLGSADVGGAWTTGGTASQFSVDPGAASLLLAAAGSRLEGFVGPKRTDADVLTAFKADRVPTGGPLYVSVTGRRVSAGNAYSTRVLVYPSGAVTIRVARLVGSVETAVAGPLTVPVLSYTAGTSLTARLQVSGTAPTSVRARVWRTGQTEPSTWQVSASDTAAALQTVGAVGMSMYLSSATTNPPITAILTSFIAGSTTAPVNQPPSAVFTSSCTGLACSFDGSGSSDPEDGTVAGYAWDFGDGSTASTVTAAHTFVSAGTYPVSLRVVDRDNAAGVVSHDVTVVAPAAPFVSDAFNRTVRNGLGSADVGGAWTTGGTASQFSVDPGAASLVLPTAGSRLEGVVGPKRTDAEVLAAFRADPVPAGGPLYVSVTGRRVSAGNAYSTRVVLYPGGAVKIRVARLVGSVETAIAGPVTVAGLTYSAGLSVTVRLQVTGTAPTSVRARVWRTGQPEPSSWQVSASDATAALQTPGAVGILINLASTASNPPITTSLTSFSAKPTG